MVGGIHSLTLRGGRWPGVEMGGSATGGNDAFLGVRLLSAWAEAGADRRVKAQGYRGGLGGAPARDVWGSGLRVEG